MSSRKNISDIVLLLTGFAVVAGLVFTIGYLSLDEDEEIIQGEVQVSQYRVSTKVPSRIAKILVKEGDFVHKGDTLVILNAPEVKAKKAQAESAREAASAVNEKADNGAREEAIAAAFELLEQAKAANDIAHKTFERINNLYEEGVVTAQRRDEAQAAVDVTDAQVLAAQSQYDMARNGTREEDRKAASAQVDMAEGAIMEVNSYINETVQVALADGEVSEIYPKVGELVGAGSPIMTISTLSDMWGTFNIREDLLSGLKEGDEFTAFSPACGKDIRMKIYYIKDKGSYSTWKATHAAGHYDLKTFEVKARPTDTAEGLRPGMSLIVRK